MKAKKYKGTVIVLDAMNCMYRGYFPNRTLEDEDGQSTGALHGVLLHIRKMKKRFPGSELVLIWDGPRDTNRSRGWRFDVAPDIYKAQRQKTEDNVRVTSQITILGWMLHYAGYLQMRVFGVEADDLIALYVGVRRKEGYKVIIDSTDKDFFQLLGDGVSAIQTQASDIRERTWEDVYGQYGVIREQWVTYRSLMGDASDGLVGLKNIGPARVIPLLEADVDPTKSYDAQPDVLKERATPEQWATVQLCYTLSMLPRELDDIDDGPLSPKREEILDAINKHKPEPDMTKFLGLAVTHNLNEVIRDRHRIINSK